MKIKDIYNFIQGNLRYQLYYSNFACLIPKHIREQIEIRINSMEKECFDSGQCIECGCTTTALQMCNKACDKPCYPSMIKKSIWEEREYMQIVYNGIYDKETDSIWKIENNKFVKHELGKL